MAEQKMDERKKLLTEINQMTAALGEEVITLISAVENDGWNKAASQRLRVAIGEFGGLKSVLRKRLRVADEA